MHLRIEVRLDSAVAYDDSLPLCRWDRGHEDGKAAFRVTPTRPLVWYGYRSDPDSAGKDPGDTTAAKTPLEVEFWQAGGETDAILLGYTVSSYDGLHMNSIHIASPVKRVTTEMAPGFTLETWPEPTRH